MNNLTLQEALARAGVPEVVELDGVASVTIEQVATRITEKVQAAYQPEVAKDCDPFAGVPEDLAIFDPEAIDSRILQVPAFVAALEEVLKPLQEALSIRGTEPDVLAAIGGRTAAVRYAIARDSWPDEPETAEGLKIVEDRVKATRMNVRKQAVEWIDSSDLRIRFTLTAMAITPALIDLYREVSVSIPGVLAVAIATYVATLMQPFHDYDKNSEQVAGFIMTHMGKVIVGLILLAQISNIFVGPEMVEVPELVRNLGELGTTGVEFADLYVFASQLGLLPWPISVSSVTALAYMYIVLKAYWNSSVGSRKTRANDFNNIPTSPTSVKHLLSALEERKEHDVADVLRRILMSKHNDLKIKFDQLREAFKLVEEIFGDDQPAKYGRAYFDCVEVLINGFPEFDEIGQTVAKRSRLKKLL